MGSDATDRTGQQARSGGAISTGKLDTAQTAIGLSVQSAAISPDALVERGPLSFCSNVGTPFVCVSAIQAWLGANAPIGARV
ncbi:MAG: hypothetical protein H0T49_08335 [Chloroflexia bacterium]|nr:hypothetical protein [Chloroflexia bacterium]